ncbi:MAG: response regulator [Gammaproteobacteria bacterium]|nr:response regulator [Gammaproteobacteria bacterium]
MSENNDSIQEVLGGKRLLFVEDRPATILFYMKQLEQCVPGLEISHAESLLEAWNLLNPVRSPLPFNIVLIDLNLPPIPPELKDYARRLETGDLNEGQALGLWLSDHYPQVRYAYLTALPKVINRELDKSQKQITVLDKNSLSDQDFPEEIVQLWTRWKSK